MYVELKVSNFMQTRAIQQSLIENKKKFDAERLLEWRERKAMQNEDDHLQALYLREHAKAEENRMERETKELREHQIEEKWRKYVQEQSIEKEMQIQQLMELAEIRGTKKGKGRRGGGGKKKKK